MLLGAFIAVLLCNADDVIREDSTKVIVMKNPSFKSEFFGLWQTMIQDPWVVLLFPMFFASNIFYTYQTNDMNGAAFNIRTRSLNNVLYWAAQIFGGLLNGYMLDIKSVRRSVRAKASLAFLVLLTFGIWGGGYAWQKDELSRDQRAALKAEIGDAAYENTLIDWKDGGKRFLGPMFLYFFYGFYDSIWQTCIYWYMGALSNSGRKAANLAGFYKGIQSAGAAVFWALDLHETPYNAMFGSTWGILAGSLVIAAPLIVYRIQDHVSIEEDLKFSDETIEDVVVGGKHIDEA